MPLYDFACRGCGGLSTLMLRYGDPAVCPDCGSGDMEKRLAPFAAGRAGKGDEHGSSHAHATSHSHAHATSSESCSSPKACGEAGPCRSSYVESVLKKYVP